MGRCRSRCWGKRGGPWRRRAAFLILASLAHSSVCFELKAWHPVLAISAGAKCSAVTTRCCCSNAGPLFWLIKLPPEQSWDPNWWIRSGDPISKQQHTKTLPSHTRFLSSGDSSHRVLFSPLWTSWYCWYWFPFVMVLQLPADPAFVNELMSLSFSPINLLFSISPRTS